MKSIALVALLFIVISCSLSMPDGFWNDFKENLQHQGPYGGYRSLCWTSKEPVFNSKEIISFAAKNGWTFVDSTNNVSNKNDSTYKFIPKWISHDFKIYSFKTGWLTIDPGTDHARESMALLF